jgi:hypothetical protein
MTAKDGKPCKKCGTSDWYSSGHCKECRLNGGKKWRKNNAEKEKERSRMWRENNPDKAKDATRRWGENNPDKSKEYAKKWRENNPDKAKETDKKWKENNRDKINEKAMRRRANNPGKFREIHRKYRENNPDKAKENQKKWRRNNQDKLKALNHTRRTRVTKAGGSFTGAEWRQLCAQYDNRCLKCGKEGKLTADHVIPVVMGGTSDISNIQPLCKSCNSSKGATIADYRTLPTAERYTQPKLIP